jgi:hypothetical protein
MTMTNCIIIFFNFIFISVYDIWQMAKAETLYWNRAGIDQDASNATSVGQFAFWYAEIILLLVMVYGLSFSALITLLSIMFLHYAGLEDVLYYVFERWIPLPERTWQNRIIRFGVSNFRKNCLGWQKIGRLGRSPLKVNGLSIGRVKMSSSMDY